MHFSSSQLCINKEIRIFSMSHLKDIGNTGATKSLATARVDVDWLCLVR
jgi:hypothetical protein